MSTNLKFLIYVIAIFFGILLGEIYVNAAEGGSYETFAGDKFAIVHEGELGAFDTSIVEVVCKTVDGNITRFKLVGGEVRPVVSPDYYFKVKDTK